jgi:hypothetical protein
MTATTDTLFGADFDARMMDLYVRRGYGLDVPRTGRISTAVL